jgi:(p)ppGpp synthase/HD superfamily hydrolase
MANLARAIELAASAHLHQTRKDGSPYILHPLRLMLQMPDPDSQMAAVLHDVVEDTPWTLEQLKAEGFPGAVIEAVALLTHDDDTPYEEYVKKIATNTIARQVKLADLRDNLDLLAIPELSEKDLQRAAKYHKYAKLLAK